MTPLRVLVAVQQPVIAAVLRRLLESAAIDALAHPFDALKVVSVVRDFAPDVVILSGDDPVRPPGVCSHLHAEYPALVIVLHGRHGLSALRRGGRISHCADDTANAFVAFVGSCRGADVDIQLRVGYDLVYDSPVPTPMVLMMSIHATRAGDLVAPDLMTTDPPVPVTAYRDHFDNWCSRIVAPAGRLRLTATAVVNDHGRPDEMATVAQQHAVEDLPHGAVVFLLGSRYCETDRLTHMAWDLFGASPIGAARVRAICDYVRGQLTFSDGHASSTPSACETLAEGTGIGRDYVHLALTLCRCMKIPARYCTGYLGDIAVPARGGPMDFAAWFEAYVGGRWHTFDPFNTFPRIGRVLIARGRDVTDVAFSTAFGPNTLIDYRVWTEEVAPPPGASMPESLRVS